MYLLCYDVKLTWKSKSFFIILYWSLWESPCSSASSVKNFLDNAPLFRSDSAVLAYSRSFKETVSMFTSSLLFFSGNFMLSYAWFLVYYLNVWSFPITEYLFTNFSLFSASSSILACSSFSMYMDSSTEKFSVCSILPLMLFVPILSSPSISSGSRLDLLSGLCVLYSKICSILRAFRLKLTVRQ